MLKLTKFPPPYGGVLTFYYTSHDMNRFIPHVHRAQPLNGFENGPNLAENRIQYVLLTIWDENSIFFSANRARPGSQKLPLNGFMEWNFLRNKEKAYQNREWIWLCGGGKMTGSTILMVCRCVFVGVSFLCHALYVSRTLSSKYRFASAYVRVYKTFYVFVGVWVRERKLKMLDIYIYMYMCT